MLEFLFRLLVSVVTGILLVIVVGVVSVLAYMAIVFLSWVVATFGILPILVVVIFFAGCMVAWDWTS